MPKSSVKTADPDWDLLSSYAGLMLLAVGTVYAGSRGSLSGPKQPKDTRMLSEEESEDEDEDLNERVSTSEAWMFPIIGSVALLGFYAAFKYLGPEWINRLVGWYFSIAGVMSVWKFAIAGTRFLVGETRWKSFDRTRVLVRKGPRELLTLSLRTPSLFFLLPSFLPSMLYAAQDKKSPLLTDILALSFAYNAITLFKLDSFATGTVLLGGLFVYDIWWVFGTEVMLSVATKLDAPVKLLWPKSTSFGSSRGYTMLGLGDIVIPGAFVALALRYDRQLKQRGKSTPYFNATLIAYASGLATTMSVMHFFGRAQPALLYLSPACVLSFYTTALLRGEFAHAWAWTDIPEGGSEATGGLKLASAKVGPDPIPTSSPSEKDDRESHGTAGDPAAPSITSAKKRKGKKAANSAAADVATN